MERAGVDILLKILRSLCHCSCGFQYISYKSLDIDMGCFALFCEDTPSNYNDEHSRHAHFQRASTSLYFNKIKSVECAHYKCVCMSVCISAKNFVRELFDNHLSTTFSPVHAHIRLNNFIQSNAVQH